MNQIKIGNFIATLRKEKKLTQEQLAEKLGVNNRTVSRWENGKSMPDMSLFKPLCKIFGITINELLEGEISQKNLDKTENNLYQAIEYNQKEITKLDIYYHFFIIMFGIIILVTTMSIIPNAVNFITWNSILGTYILLIIASSLIKYVIKKKKSTKYLIGIIITFFILYFVMLYTIDFINVKSNNLRPLINSTPFITEQAIAYDTPLYDVYDCEPYNSRNKLIIKYNSKDIYNNIQKYCQ